MSEHTPRVKREPLGWPPRAVALPVALVLAIIVVWSAIWYGASRRADAMLDTWLAAQSAQGRQFACAERSLGGYPFRIELDCIQPSADLADGAPRVVMSAGRLRGVAMVWKLDHLIVEMEGPLAIQSPSSEEPSLSLRADWALWQASLRAPGGRISKVDLAVDELEVAPGPEVEGALAMRARRLELHERHTETGSDAQLAVHAVGLAITLEENAPPHSPLDLSLVGRILALPQPLPRDAADFLTAWRDNDGAIEIEELRATQGETVARATGRLVADAAGRPEGIVTLSLAGPDVGEPGAAGAFGGLAPIVAAALRFAGEPSEIDGRDAVSGDVELRSGRVYLGPMPIARLPELF